MTLVRVGFIAVPPGAKQGFDHADVHRATRRMYVAHTGADRVDVLDCEQQTYVRSLSGLPGVAGVLIDEEHDLLFTSDRGAARVSIFRCSDERLLARVGVGAHPNGLAYDRRRRKLYAFNLGEPLGESCSASVIDLGSMEVAAELSLPGRPRWALYDESRDRVYANIRDPAVIAVIDAGVPEISQAFAVSGEGPHGLALLGDRLFCGADGAALVVLDATTGEEVESLSLPGEPDVVLHDPRLRRLYVAIGDPGVVCSFDTERLEHLETVETEVGAHTAGWDPDGCRLYVFCPDSGGATVFEERG